MENSHIISLLIIAFCFGNISNIIIQEIIKFFDFKNKTLTPFRNLKKRGLDIYTFVYRQGDYAVINYDKEYLIYLDVINNTFSVFKGKDIKFLYGNYIKEHTIYCLYNSEFDEFVKSLLNKFNNVITDTINVNGLEVSKNNLSKETIEYYEKLNGKEPVQVPVSVIEKSQTEVLNSILDKINETGIESLTSEEREFLNKTSEK